MIILNDDLAAYIEMVKLAALENMGKYFDTNYDKYLSETKQYMFLTKMLKPENSFYMGASVTDTICNLTTLWLYEYQGYDYEDALNMSVRHHERGWESYLYRINEFTKLPVYDVDLDPWGKRRRFIKFKDLHGVIIHRVHTHKNCIIASFIFSDGHNAYLTKECIVSYKGNNKWYVTQKEQNYFFNLRNVDIAEIYSL